MAKVLDKNKPGSGEPGGTLGYTAPEIVDGLSTGTKESDIFSFGVILYELVGDYNAENAGTSTSIGKSSPFLAPLDDYTQQFVDDKHLDSLMFHSEVHESFSEIVRQCLSFAPKKRCSAKDVVKVLSALATDD